ncbi:ROK family protein [candidate division WOR-3 bacterium]|nr:ROK family protein [candidate division WOR-3 bacterium]
MGYKKAEEYGEDERVVLTLDAGGTNFVFSAVKGNKFIRGPFSLESNGGDLDLCLKTITQGFKKASEGLKGFFVAASIGFPGPADYREGIIYELVNLKAFDRPFPLGPYLKEKMKIPVFINNDADLFALGEFIFGITREINEELKTRNSKRRSNNLVAATFGTGLGGGIVAGGKLLDGDNSAQGELNRLRNHLFPNSCTEDSVSDRGIKRSFRESGGVLADESAGVEEIAAHARDPFSEFHEQAKNAFALFAKAAADSLANALSLIDGALVIGGGISNAHDVFLEQIVKEMNMPFDSVHGVKIPRTEVRVFNLEDREDREKYLAGKIIQMPIPGTSKIISVDIFRGAGIGVSKIGTGKAAALGACVFALEKLG